MVLKGSGVFMVEFYAPWCGHCKSLAPEWKKAAKALKGLVTVVAVDATESQSLASKYEIKGFPTIKVFGAAKTPSDYSGAREAPAIVSFAMQQASALAKARLSGGGGGGGAGAKKPAAGSKPAGGAGKGSGGGNHGSDSSPGGGKAVVTLTPDNFDALVLSGEGPWMVEFYAPWCGHCKSLAPEWAAAAEQTAGEGVRFGAVDADAHRELGSRFGVKGFPTIKTFPATATKDGDARDYNGPRSASDLAAAALKLAEGGGGKPSVAQVTSAGGFTEACAGKKVCLCVVLPHILDEGAAKRAARLEALGAVAGKVRGGPVKLVWWEAGAQPAVEAALGISMYPAAAAVSVDKGIFIPHRAPVDEKGLSGFAASLTRGTAGATPMPKGFDWATALVTTEPWDGKDGVAPVDEPLDL